MNPHAKHRIAITGSGGLVGRELTDRLAEGFHVRAFSRRAGPGREALTSLLSRDTLGSLDHILHLAWSALPVTADSESAAEEDPDLTLLGSLLDAISGLREDARPALVFFSSGAVYGNALREGGCTEEDDPAPLGRYAAKKREAELLIQRRAAAEGLPALVLRISNLYGSLPAPERPQGVIPKLISSALHGETFRLWGIDAKKDYLHMDDFESALRAILAHNLRGVCNVSFGRSWFTSEVIETVESVTGLPVPLVVEEPKSWDVSHTEISRDKLSRETGWEPRIDLRGGIERMCFRYFGESGILSTDGPFRP